MTLFRSLLTFDLVAWRYAVVLIICSAAGMAGCTSDVPTPGSAKATPPRTITLKFRADGGESQKVSIIEDDPSLVHIRVQREDGSSFYTHRSFVKKADGDNILLTASEVLEKPQGEEYYFRLKEFNVIRDRIPGLFMTTSGRRVVGPWKAPRFEHDGEMAWPVYECTKADCPGRMEEAEHGHLFILSDPRYTVGSDPAEVSRAQDREDDLEAGSSREDMLASADYLCPQCRARSRPGPDDALKQEFRRYKLPESEAMWQALDDEYKQSRQIRLNKYGDR